MMGPAIVGGNRVVDLQNGVEIFPAMLEAIRGATHDDQLRDLHLLVGRHRPASWPTRWRARAAPASRWRSSSTGPAASRWTQALLATMESAGVRVERYRPLHWYNLGRMNNRTHRKLLVVDGRVALHRRRRHRRSLAGQRGGSRSLARHPLPRRRSGGRAVPGGVQRQLDQDHRRGAERRRLTFRRCSRPAAPTRTCSSARRPRAATACISMYLMASLAAAERSIDLTASYFVPDALIDEALLAARQRGVRVRILLPGPHIDSDVVRLSSRSRLGTAACRPASRSTSTSRRCCTPRCSSSTARWSRWARPTSTCARSS